MNPAGGKTNARQPWVVRVLAWILLPCVCGAEILPPAWVGKFPRLPDAYVGIGKVNKQEHPDNYRELAQSAALAQISREISAQVKSEITATQAEDGLGMQESYAQKIMLASDNDLAGYRTAGVYETIGEYWVLYVLEKSAHQKILDEKTDRLTARLLRAVKDLRADLESRRFGDAMDRYSELRKEHTALITTSPLSDGRRASLDSLCDSARAMLREAARNPLEISVELQAEGSGVPEEAVRRLRGALSQLQFPFYRVTQKFRDGSTLKIRILGMDRDTLEGLTFTSMRGEVCWPGDPIPQPVRGKSGHPDRDRSLSLALRDFVKDLERLHP